MDRTAWIVVILCVIGLGLWTWWTTKQQAQMRPAQQALSPSATPIVAPSASAIPSTPAPPVPTASVSPTAAPTPAIAEKTETLRNDDVDLRLTNRGGGIAEATLLNHIGQGNDRVVLNAKDQMPIGAMIEKPGEPQLDEFTLSKDPDGSVKCERVAENITIRKKFFFPPSKQKKDNFLAEMDVDLVNGGAQPYSNPGYFIALGSAAPVQPKEYPVPKLFWSVNGKAKNVDVGWFAASNGLFGMFQRPARPVFEEATLNAEWAAVSNQFFTTLIAPLTGKSDKVWARRFDVDATKQMDGIAGAIRMPGFQLPPGQTYSAKFEIWAGPKLYHRLAQLDHNEAEIMDFGFFKIVCQLLLNSLNALHHLLGNYAAAILALTVIVKMILWPIQNKANRTGRQMALLGPKMQELKEKYKDDPTRMNQETMKLYKDYGINPVGGCLPMLIQFPVFIGLFTMLRQTVELRGASFLWIHDLSQPDTVAHLPILNLPINVLPLLSALSSWWMIHVTPKTGDPTQQRVMYFMPVIFVALCYNFAAALALYYTVQNVLSIVQLYYNKRQPMPTLEKRLPPGKRK